MGNTQNCIVASLSVCSTYLFYHYIYCSYQSLKTNVLSGDKLPSFVYLYVKYLTGLVTRRTGHLYTDTLTKTPAIVYTILNCRLESSLMRRFCCAAGYGWDYPDTDFRDIPLCFPEILCCKLLLMLLTDGNFRLSPAGLVRVRQTVKSLQPVDELKKGPFMLQVRVLQYEQTATGVEVDICLSATSRSGCLVWESILTLLSKKPPYTASGCLAKNEDKCCLPDEPGRENLKQVELQVPRTIGLQCVWSFSDYSPHWLCSLPARLFGFRSQIAPPLWMLSVCLAEIEKHKGVDVVTAPVNVTAHFKDPLVVPGKVLLRFWDETKNVGQSSGKNLSFQMEQQGHNICHIVGLISRL
ncbi:uncharacterized protein si:ch211-12e13.1 isoform X2 [Melanotaenia boesemani]|uniref:uncharacterized protein si:ch211-12e13.1 isoform X2 n=1 Tax=Melanotaenia boesemani TaxID=1250792 RepID=UPI001C043BF3|nr:uncharacterized protein si:ch211-12e13.1 isoform X2 [Melanotaenia boesemani]